MPQSGVYVILNRATGACYVGSSIRLTHRKEQHFNALRRGGHYSLHLQRSFNKHGESAFIFHVLEIVIPHKDYLLMREQYWIDLLKPLYNSRIIASSNLGMKHSEATRKKQSEAAKKRPPLPRESILRGAEKLRNRKHTAEELRKQSISLKLSWQTRVLTDVDRQRQSERSKAYWSNITEEQRKTHSENASQAHMNLKRSEESRKKQSETLLAQERKHTEESRQLMSERRKEAWARKGVTEEDRKRLSAQAKSAWDNKPEEEKAKAIQALQNNGCRSEEAQRKRSASLKAYWAKRKQAQLNTTEETP